MPIDAADTQAYSYLPRARPRMSLWLDVAADDTIAPANSSSKVVEFFALGDANVHVHE